MNEFISLYHREVLAALLLLARVGDVVSTRIVTPSLRLEANPIVRRLGWRFAVATLFIAALPLVVESGLQIGVALLVAYCLVTATNLRAAWFASALGEERYIAVMEEAIRRCPRSRALALVGAGGAFAALPGGALMVFHPDPYDGLGWWFGLGLVGYGLAITMYQSAFLNRAYARVASGSAAA